MRYPLGIELWYLGRVTPSYQLCYAANSQFSWDICPARDNLNQGSPNVSHCFLGLSAKFYLFV